MEKPETALARPDRDLLIAVSTKQDRMAQDINEIKTGLIERISKTEVRLDANDVYHAKIPLTELIQDAADWRTFHSNFKFILATGGIALTTFGAILGRIFEKWLHF